VPDVQELVDEMAGSTGVVIPAIATDLNHVIVTSTYLQDDDNSPWSPFLINNIYPYKLNSIIHRQPFLLVPLHEFMVEFDKDGLVCW
jgi:hypothetical protein